MFGPPEDKPGECNARLFIGDDFGDNTTTMRCGLAPGLDSQGNWFSVEEKPHAR